MKNGPFDKDVIFETRLVRGVPLPGLLLSQLTALDATGSTAATLPCDCHVHMYGAIVAR